MINADSERVTALLRHLYATAFLAGAGLTAFFSSWYALLTLAVPAVRRGRVFGVVSAIGNVGTVAGALGWPRSGRTSTLPFALLLASLTALAASLALSLLPADQARVATPEAVTTTIGS